MHSKNLCTCWFSFTMKYLASVNNIHFHSKTYLNINFFPKDFLHHEAKFSKCSFLNGVAFQWSILLFYHNLSPLTPSPFREERGFPWCPLLDRNSKEETPEHELSWWRMDRESKGGPGACGGFCRQQESFDFLSEYKTVSEIFLFHQFLLSEWS